MERPSKNTSQHDNQGLSNLKLLDEATNEQYVIKVPMEVYERAHSDMIFATTLLQKAKSLLNSKSTHNPPTNMMANDISKYPSCLNVTTSIVCNDTVENILNIPDTENISDTSDTEVNKERWGHSAILLLISLYKEKSYMLEKGSHKKMRIEISRCMKEKKYKFTSSQCNNKMDALKRRYRQIIDHNAQSENDRKEWIYLEVLHDIFQKKHWVKPLVVAGSNIKESEHFPLTDSDENKSPADKRRKISLTEARVDYLTVSLEEKRLKREETAHYRESKLKILRKIKEMFENWNQQ